MESLEKCRVLTKTSVAVFVLLLILCHKGVFKTEFPLHTPRYGVVLPLATPKMLPKKYSIFLECSSEWRLWLNQVR